jgi:hypothetical protein
MAPERSNTETEVRPPTVHQAPPGPPERLIMRGGGARPSAAQASEYSPLAHHAAHKTARKAGFYSDRLLRVQEVFRAAPSL